MTGNDVFDIDLYHDSTSDEIEHQLHRLRNHPLWTEAISDPMHPSNAVARRALRGLVLTKEEAMEAEAIRPSPPPDDVTPMAAKALHDRLMADPKFRRAYRDPGDPRQAELTDVVQQLLHWAHPPDAGRGAGGSAGAESAQPGLGRDAIAPSGAKVAGRAIASRLADATFAAAYMDRDHPGHADAVTEIRGLHEAAATDAANTNE